MHDQPLRVQSDPATGSPSEVALRAALIGPDHVPAPPDRPIESAGVDLADADRLARAIDRSGDRLVRRLFHAHEREVCADGQDRDTTAALFGIKESVVKVVGGLSSGARYIDISIGPPGKDLDNPPWLPVQLRGELARWAQAHRVEVVAGTAPLREGLRLSWALALPLEAPC
ncbi:MAG TPA: 4'-phosphopantetheinyl transferase superfamily protein [Micromonosporaceae bacterium]|jgi:phosphopantetheinyl transferase (holo-ACP synthase)|nr:4'-phosphopantetheinyl transferase superfamily protein [Micromonosporaceae bacterium]